jgi:phosphoglucomutase
VIAKNAPVKNVPAHDRGSRIDPRAGHSPSAGQLVDVGKLLDAYYKRRPDPAVPAQQVAFGTSGHRGSSFDGTFNEAHVLSITQAICMYRQRQRISGPLFVGFDTHALSRPAFESALEVLDKTDAEIVEASGATFLLLMTAVVVGKRNNDQALLDRLAWFTDACRRELDGVASSPRADA